MIFSGFRAMAAAALIGALSIGNAHAQDEASSIERLDWKVGPSTVSVSGRASLYLPEGYRFLDAGEAKKFMELTQNIASENEYILAPDDFRWWTVFEFSDIGYVKDNESLDSADILDSIKQGTAAGNEERRRRGWDTMTITGWRFEPRYDKTSNLLEWAVAAKSDKDQSPIINYNTRLLGRSGVMEVVLIAEPKVLDGSVAELKRTLQGFRYNSGETYAEYREGDSTAAYGLAALVTGGAAAVATKKGLWPIIAAFFLKAWKLVLLGFAGLVALFRGKAGKDNAK